MTGLELTLAALRTHLAAVAWPRYEVRLIDSAQRVLCHPLLDRRPTARPHHRALSPRAQPRRLRSVLPAACGRR